MPRQFGNYEQLFARFEKEFNVEDLTFDNIMDFLGVPTSGRQSLAEQLSESREISLEIEETQDINELRDIQKNISRLSVHQLTLSNAIGEKIIALSITTAEQFAEARSIELTEEVTGNIEIWADGIERLVIRENGHFKAWKRV